MKRVLVASLFAAVAAQPPQTGIPCSWRHSPIDVPKDPDLYLGTWYTIGITNKAWNRNHMCTQINITPDSGGGQNRVYTGATFASSPEQATPNINLTKYKATLVAADLTTFDPPYKLLFPFPGAAPNPFYVAATDGDGTPGGITAVAFYACDGGGGNNSQLFYLSRAPYFMPPVTVKRLAAKVAKAIGNAADIQLDLVAQAAGWCDYAFPPTAASVHLDQGTAIAVAAATKLEASIPATKKPLDCCGDKTFGPIDCSCSLDDTKHCVNGKAPCKP
jgi:hypothetical protein